MDGYGDNSDDFPSDERYYEKEGWGFSGETEGLTKELKATKGSETGDYLSTDWKYVYVEWEVVEPPYLTEEQQDYINLNIENPEYQTRMKYPYSSTENRNKKIYINANNWGDWRIGFANENGLYNEGIDIKIEYTLYKVR